MAEALDDSEAGKSDLARDPKQEADALGMDMILPGPDELFVDLDSLEAHSSMSAGIKILNSNGLCIEVVRIRESRSGIPHAHAYLKVKTASCLPLTPLERICLQACLGSDRGREALSFLRIKKQTCRPPTVFFEKKEQP